MERRNRSYKYKRTSAPHLFRLVFHDDEVNPDHHLCRTKGSYQVSFIITNGIIVERIRKSLYTKDLLSARKRRDKLFANLQYKEFRLDS